MDISRMKKVFAGMSAVAISLTQMGTVFAAYSDVAAGVWYEEAVDAFTDAGYLDGTQTRFRGGDNANRAEFTKLVVELNGGILSTAPSVPSFDDVKPGAWYYGYMEEAAKEGWVKGDGNCYGSHPCNARPGANINRAEAAALIVRAFGLEWTGDAPSFVDVPSGQWYTDPVQTAADHCVLQGDDATGRARPADFMNRAEMVVMLYRVDQGLTYGVDCEGGEVDAEPMIKDVTPTSDTTVEVEFNVALDEDAAVDADLYMISGASDIEVTSVEWIDASTVELTLGESTDVDEDYTVSVEDMMTEDGETFSDSMDFSGYTEVEQGDGILEVSMASTNPSSDTVPKGAVGVVLTSIDVTASCDDSVVISEITVLHEGFGDSSDITGLYAAIDGGRVSRKRSIDSEDQTADLRFSEPLTIAACKTQTIDLVADFDTGIETGSEHNLAVELPSDFQSNAKDVEGNFPIRGNTFRIAAVTSGQVSVDYRTISPNEIDVGDTGRVVGKFELSSNSIEDQTVYSVTLEQNGSSSDGDLKNIKIRRSDGTVLTNTASTTVGDYVTLVFDPPFTILEGDNITLEVVADIEGGAGETIVMHFEETSDVFAVGSLYGYGVNGQLYGSRVVIADDDADPVSIEAGEFTVEVDGPVQQKYTRDDDDAVLAKINLITGSSESIDVQDMYIAIEGQTATGAGLASTGNTEGDSLKNEIHEVLEDVELRNTKTGQTISAVALNTAADDRSTSTTATWQIYRFDDFIVDGSTSWELRVDFIENSGAHPKSGDRFRTHVCVEPVNTASTTVGCDFGGLITATEAYNLSLEGLSTGEIITDARPGGDITGNFHRIAAPELNVAVKAIGSTDTAVRNSKNVNLLRFEARAGEAEDILLTSAVFEAAGGSLLNAQNYALWVDTDGDAVVDTILEKGASAQNDQVSFDDLAGGGYVVPAEETVMFEVHADIASNFTSSLLALRFDTGATSYIEAEEVDDGSSLSGISTNGSSATANIVVTTVYSKLYTLVTGGDLFVTKDSESVRSRQLLGGTLGDSVLRLNFRAQNEDIDVTDIQIASSGSLAGSVDRLELYKAGETTAFATATVGGCGSDAKIGQAAQNEQTFCASMQSRQLTVTKGQDIDVIIRPRMKTDENGATSGENILFWTGTGGITARGVNSSNELTINDGDGTADGEVVIGANTSTSNAQIRGNDNEVVLAKITSITNANPDSDNTNVPTGVRPVGQFRFTAASNSNTLNGVNKAALSGVIFNVSATSVDMNSANFKWYNRDDANAKVACNVVGSVTNSGSLAVRCMDTTAINTEIDSGQSVTFVLESDIQSVSTNGTLQVSIQSFTDVAETAFGTSDSHLVWQDKDTSTTTFFWVEYGDTVVNSTSYKS